jgi:uncharacterized protein YvpB
MKRSSIGGLLIISAVLGSSLALGPAQRVDQTTLTMPSLPLLATLPETGLGVAAMRNQHGIQLEANAADPPELYEQLVPAAPAARPKPAAPAGRPTVLRPTAPASVVTIPVPTYRQAMTLDCETSALRMGLAYYGHYYSDAALFAGETVDSRPPVMGPNHTVVNWGDPYTNFVGNVWGSDTTPTGYGVYYPKIVSIARSHGLPKTYGGEGFAPRTIYSALSARHPVEVWVETNWMRPRLGTWTAWDGRKIRYSYVEHAVILTGVSATQVRVNDPLHGTQYWIGKAQFETVWRDFNDMAVILQ